MQSVSAAEVYEEMHIDIGCIGILFFIVCLRGGFDIVYRVLAAAEGVWMEWLLSATWDYICGEMQIDIG